MITWSQGTANAAATAPERGLNEPGLFTQTMGVFGRPCNL